MDNFYPSNFMNLLVIGQFKKKTCWTNKTFNNIRTRKITKTNKKYIKSKILIKYIKIKINFKIKVIFLNKKVIRMYLSLYWKILLYQNKIDLKFNKRMNRKKEDWDNNNIKIIKNRFIKNKIYCNKISNSNLSKIIIKQNKITKLKSKHGSRIKMEIKKLKLAIFKSLKIKINNK